MTYDPSRKKDRVPDYYDEETDRVCDRFTSRDGGGFDPDLLDPYSRKCGYKRQFKEDMELVARNKARGKRSPYHNCFVDP